MIALYVAALLFLRAAGERHWLLIFLRYMPPVLLLAPLPLILLLARPSRAHSVLAVAAFLMLFSGLSLHLPRRSSLVVMSWNIRAGTSGLEEVEKLLAETNPDIVLLQEARVPARGGPDPLPALRGAYHVARGGSGGELAILSRFPILTSQELPLWPARPALQAELQLPGRTLRVVNVHYGVGDAKEHLLANRHGKRAYLRRTAEARRIQTDALLNSLTPDVLVGGDFNSPPGSYTQETLSRKLHDAHQEAGLGFGQSYPAHRPFWRIDYLFSSARPTGCWTPAARGSDHRPVIACYSL